MQDQPVNKLKHLQAGDSFVGQLLVKAAQVRISSNGSKYLDGIFADSSGEINVKSWNWGETTVPDVGSVVHVRAGITEFNSRLQMRVDKLRSVESQLIDWSSLVPTAPEDPDAMFEEIWQVADSFEDEQLKILAEQMLLDNKEKLLLWPAAINFHHAQRGGLLYHTLTMIRAAIALLPIYKFLDRNLLLCSIILHDLQKLNEINATEQGIATNYSNEGMLLGHIVMGVSEIDKVCHDLGLTQERTMLIKHLLLSHHERPEYGSPVPPLIPEAEVLHALDQMDARLFAMVSALELTKPGDLSERVRSLDGRKIYRRTDSEYL
jgi:3'-5' exoribonuclease